MTTSAMKEAFCLFDRDADGLIHARDIPIVIRSLGVNPTEQELNQMLANKEDAMFSFEDFLKFTGGKYSMVDQEADLNKSFSLFDRENNGTVSCGELKHVLLNLGEKLSEEEVNELLEVADPGNTGHIKYGEFISKLCKRV